MIDSKPQRPSPRLLWLALVLCLLAIGYAGLDTGRFAQSNQAKLSEQHGLELNRYSAAHTSILFSSEQAQQLNHLGYKLNLSIEPASLKQSNFQIILLLSNGDQHNQWLLGQWRDQLVLMNGDDYNAERKRPRLVAPLNKQGAVQVKVVASGKRVSLVVDGQHYYSRLQPFLAIPDNARLVLGGSGYLSHGWQGSIRRLSVSSLEPADKLLVFDFTRSTQSYTNPDISVSLPANLSRLWQAEPLSLEGGGAASELASRDVLINALGFMPLGMVLILLLVCYFPQGRRRYWIIVSLVLGALLSGAIEYAQSWLPGRHSSARDWLLNSLGAALGALCIAALLWQQRRKLGAKEQPEIAAGDNKAKGD